MEKDIDFKCEKNVFFVNESNETFISHTLCALLK